MTGGYGGVGGGGSRSQTRSGSGSQKKSGAIVSSKPENAVKKKRAKTEKAQRLGMRGTNK